MDEMSRCFEVQYEIIGIDSSEQNSIRYETKKLDIKPISCNTPYETEYPIGQWIGMEIGDRYSEIRTI